MRGRDLLRRGTLQEGESLNETPAPEPPKMGALGMLLKSMGLDANVLLAQLEDLKKNLPLFANHLKSKVDQIDERLNRLAQQQLTVVALCHEILSQKRDFGRHGEAVEALIALRDGVDTVAMHCDPLPVLSSWRYVVDQALKTVNQSDTEMATRS